MELKRAGLLTSAGLATAAADDTYGLRPVIPELPTYIAEARLAHPKTWSHLQELAPTYRRHFVLQVHSAKRPERAPSVFSKSIALLEAGKKLGLK